MWKHLDAQERGIATSLLVVLTSFTSLYTFGGCHVDLVAARQAPCDDRGGFQPADTALYVQVGCIMYISCMVRSMHMLCTTDSMRTDGPPQTGFVYPRDSIIQWLVAASLVILTVFLIPVMNKGYGTGSISYGSYTALVAVAWNALMLYAYRTRLHLAKDA